MPSIGSDWNWLDSQILFIFSFVIILFVIFPECLTLAVEDVLKPEPELFEIGS